MPIPLKCLLVLAPSFESYYLSINFNKGSGLTFVWPSGQSPESDGWHVSRRGVSQAIALEEVNSILPEVAVQPYGVLGVLDGAAVVSRCSRYRMVQDGAPQ